MSAEPALIAALSPLVAGRVFLDVAQSGSALPRIVCQQVGGSAINYTEGAVPDTENGRMQVACWAVSRVAAVALAKQAEAALLGAPGIQCTALGARYSIYEEDTQLYGSRQDFSVWSAR